MGHKHSREQILDGALQAAFTDGLSQLTFGRLAKHLGINDRTIVYYFPTKDDLVAAVLVAIGTQLQAVLGEAFTRPAADHVELARVAWPVLARPESDPVFRLFFEAIGLAAAGREPYGSLAPGLMASWTTWLEGSFAGTPRQRRASAEATMALLDGLLLMRQLVGADAADRAAAELGVLGSVRARR